MAWVGHTAVTCFNQWFAPHVGGDVPQLKVHVTDYVIFVQSQSICCPGWAASFGEGSSSVNGAAPSISEVPATAAIVLRGGVTMSELVNMSDEPSVEDIAFALQQFVSAQRVQLYN